jgi:hypothetical protein
MSNIKITQLPELAPTPLSGSDVFPVVSGNVTYQVTANAIADFAGGGANTGNVTFDNQIVIGTGDSGGGGGLYLAPGDSELANLQYFRVRGGDVPSHLHFDTGNVDYYDQYFGDDGKYVKLEAGTAGNIVIGTDNNVQNWIFDNTGNTTIPGNIQTVTTGFPFTSNISGINTGSPTVLVTVIDAVFGAPETGQVTISGVVGTTEANNTWYYLSIDPSNFQLYYDAALQNPVNGTSWTAYISGGLAFAAGYSDLGITGGNVSITTNTDNTWTFDNAGNLTLPGNAFAVNYANGTPVTIGSGGSANSISNGTSNVAIPSANSNVVVGIAGSDMFTFGTDGNLTFLHGGKIAEVVSPVPGNYALALSGTGVTDPDQQLLVYPTSLDEGHLHLTSGNLYNVELFLGNDDLYVKLANTGNVIINTNDGVGNTAQWAFGIDGITTFPNNTILNTTGDDLFITTTDSNGIVNSSIELAPTSELTRIEQWSGQNSMSFTTADWATGVYTVDSGLGAVQFTGAANIVNFVNSLNAADVGHIFLSVNGGPQLVWDGTSTGGDNITFNTPTLPAVDPTTVTTFDYYYSFKSGFEIDYDSSEVNIYANDADINLSTTNQKDILLNSSRDMIVAGNGAVALTNFSNIDGITINTDTNGTSRQWTFDAGGNLRVPQGGYIGAAGVKGDGTMLTGGKGNIASLTSFYANANALNYSSCVTVNADGTLNITTYGDGTGLAGQWTFDSNGTLTLPGEGVVRSNNDTISLESWDTANSLGYGMYIGTTGGLYFQQATNPNWLSIAPNASNVEIAAGVANTGEAGHSISIASGSADQGTYNTSPGGNINITGGLGAFNDGGGGGPGGSVNITAGNSSDPAGVAGNVVVNSGTNTWTFDNTGNLSAPGTITANTFISNAFNVVTAGNLLVSSQYGLGTVGTILEQDGLLELIGNSTGGCVVVGWNSSYGNLSNVAQMYFSPAGSTGNIVVTTGDLGNTSYAWTYDNTGNLTLPGNTFAVNYANGTPVSIGGGSSVAEAPFSIQSVDFNATAGNRYGIATGGGSVTATLPATPATGDAVYFADAAGAYSTNAFIVSPNGGTIMGVSGSMTVTTNGQSFGLFYNGSTWRTYS